jgi:nucleotide-binding universal stress UspA family protein
MSASGLFLVVLSAWFAIGVILAIVMGRRGHAPFTWFVLGTLLGPFGVLLAADAARRERRLAPAPGAAAPAAAGGLAVLVGVDGSAESLSALDAACALLGPRIGRLTLAAVVSYDAAEEPALATERAAAAEALADAAARAAAFAPDTVVLAGRPDDALARRALEGGYDVLVVGRRGRGPSKAVLGSVAARLAARTPVPVLVGGTPVKAASGTPPATPALGGGP